MNVSRRQFLGSACCWGVIGLVGSYPIFIERYLIQVNTYRIPVPNLPSAFSGFRIVHLTDLHHGLLVPLAVIHHVVSQANTIRPDLILCTGDYVHQRNTSSEIDQVWPVMAQLTAPCGVYSVLGNHDHWADTNRSLYWLERTRQDIRHKAVRIDREKQSLWVAGAGDLYEDHRNLDIVLSMIPEEDCRLVLAHNPDSADTTHSRRIDLMISGHTHGGQVVIPFFGAPVLPVKNKSYSSGLKCSPQGEKIFISRGIGWAICPVRFNCLPEIAVLELTPES
jgi:predicted MPP superfamily phosphohydrolase